MTYPFHRLLVAAGILSLVSCQKETTANPSTALEGTWRLTSRQCYCLPTPLPDETVTFTATQFTFYGGNRRGWFGSYTLAMAATPCFNDGTTGPALHLTYSAAGTSPAGPSDIQYRLDGDTLTLDYGGPCDAPVDTYERLP